MAASAARMRILQLIEDGQVSAAEGLKLLDALSADEAAPAAAEPPATNPDLDYWRRWWIVPMWVGTGVLLVGALLMFAAYQTGGLGFWFLCAALPFAAGAFDLVVSFETLEHLAAQERLLAGFARVLADEGVLVISSPDRHVYSEVAGFRNEFHVRELYRDELLALLRPHFAAVRLYGQKLLFHSALWSLEGGIGSAEAHTAAAGGDAVAAGLDHAPMYFVAVCARRALPAGLPSLSLFGDREESVYAHYNHEVRKNIDAGTRIAELESELARLRAGMHGAARPPGPRRRWWQRNRNPE